VVFSANDETCIYRRLCRELELVGRIDQFVVALTLDVSNLPGLSAAPAQIATAVIHQLKLRNPPELDRLVKIMPGWENEPLWIENARVDLPPEPRRATAVLAIAPISRDIKQFGMITEGALFFLALMLIQSGQYQFLWGILLSIVVVLLIAIPAVVILVFLSRYPEGPRSISEAQLANQVRLTRERFFPRLPASIAKVEGGRS